MGNNLTAATSFHSYLDTELIFKSPRVVETKETKHFIIQEREVSYRIYPHFHPYVGQLVQRLLRKSTAALQAADTEYEPNNVSLPGSVEVAVGENTALSLPGNSPFALLSDVQATLPGPETITLAAKMRLRLANAAQATVPDGMRAALFDGMTNTPSIGSVLNLPQNMGASVTRDTKVTLTSATQITLPNGTPASIAAGAQVLLLSGSELSLPKATPVTLLRSKPRPTLYADILPKRFSPSALVQRPYPVKDLDFTASGAYSVYNWELFFHVPMMIAIHLSKNQRFAEAQRWFHFLFDPTDDSDGPTPERFWKVRPFQTTEVKKIEDILVNLATGEDPTLRDETVRSIEAWKDAPFRPHVIARYRQQAYMYKTVMAYLDNLIAWGDSLFRQDTGEAIDEALMLYALAANILGPRPQAVPKKGSVRPQTYANLRADLKQFGVVMREAETAAPFDLMPFPTEAGGDNERLATLRSLGKALYFCVPRNDKLLSYWDTVADRLFKIRNSLNFQGIFRQLALFEPPIDPALLARAAAAGLDVGAIVNGLNQPLPLVRFQLLAQKAADICQEVKALGSNLLSAMEKEDNEALAILRARHERIVMEMVEHVRYAQVQEAITSKEGLLKSLALAVQRYTYYERQLGKKPDDIMKAIPELNELDKDSLEKMKFDMTEPEVAPREIGIEIAENGLGSVGSATFGLVGEGDIAGGKKLNKNEAEELDKLELAHAMPGVAKILNLSAQGLSQIPDFPINLHFWGLGGTVVFGGTKLAALSSFAADAALAYAGTLTYEANRAGKVGLYTQRERDWAFQSTLAAGEINLIFKQLRAAQIREAIAERELHNHRLQMKHAELIERFLNEEGAEKTGKKTNKALYVWMKREVKGLYGQCFQFAFDIAKKAERALQHELGNPELSYLQFGYLAGKEGLLAGEKLYLDVKRMEMAYHDLNRREYELTRHVSLSQVNPLALLQLRATGRCVVALPEALFDMDGPGHYFRRIKSVAVSIPCVAGPYASVNCTLTLLKNSIRKTQLLRDGAVYAREDAEDSRFNDYFGSSQSIVTSSAQYDSGLFETNLRDERYLPFENCGAISEWQLELPTDVRQFNYDTISDVILHIRYTAREGGGLLRNGAVSNLRSLIEEAQAAGSVRLFSIRHEFPTEWAKFKSVKIEGATKVAELTLNFREEHYPFWSRSKDGKSLNETIAVRVMEFLAKPSAETKPKVLLFNQPSGEGTTEQLDQDKSLNNIRRGKLNNDQIPKPIGKFTRFFNDNSMDDLWLTLAWGKK